MISPSDPGQNGSEDTFQDGMCPEESVEQMNKTEESENEPKAEEDEESLGKD